MRKNVYGVLVIIVRGSRGCTFDLLPLRDLSKVRSRFAGHTQRWVFFVKPKGFRIQCAHRSFYASINALCAHLIHKISFYLAKNIQKFAYVQFL